MGLKIDLYCNDGSPLGVTPAMIYNRGVGGAELAMLTLVQYLAKAGHRVRVYNNPIGSTANEAGVEFLSQHRFRPDEERDIFIAFRSPNPFVKSARGVRIHWSCDQYTIGNFATDVFPFVERVVCISPYHRDYHIHRYALDPRKATYIDLGVNLDDYLIVRESRERRIPKDEGHMLWCSVPGRGLEMLARVWPAIKQTVPHATLSITGDYRLWGAPSAGDLQFRRLFAGQEGVDYMGKIPRLQLAEEQLRAELLIGPLDYEELFCLAVAEAQCAGCVPITSAQGALPTTAVGGVQIGPEIGVPGSLPFMKAYTDSIIRYLTNRKKLEEEARSIKRRARYRFDWAKIVKEWEALFDQLLTTKREKTIA